VRHLLSVPPFTDPRVIVELAVTAEASGWDGYFLWDHLRWDDRQEVHDPWVLLGAIAARTSSIVIGTLVTPMSRRRPWVVAKHLVTLDHLTGGGRVVLGVGLGDPPDLDFSDFGDVSDNRVRGAVLDETLEVVAGLVAGERVEHDGEHHQVHAAMRPAASRVPIWVAGRTPHRRPLERARRWDGYAPIGSGLSPDAIPALVGAPPREGWDLVVPWETDAPAAEYEAAGVTWLVTSVWPTDEGWVDELRDLAGRDPRS
jgi:alkanesulfonate monooxygenase SsuD/methylene tetrahydromethanopterin reductase-like flavin-dependent oxidoreductase (luciferase family)